MNSPGMAIPEAIQLEYKELCAYHRHQRGLTWQSGSILITASLAIFGIVASRHDILPLSVLFASGTVSLVTLTLFWLAFERISYLNDIIKARMKKIEVEFGMYLIRAYTEVDSEYGRETNHPIGRRLHITWLIRVLVIVYAMEDLIVGTQEWVIIDINRRIISNFRIISSHKMQVVFSNIY